MAGVKQEFDNGLKVDGDSIFSNSVTFSNSVIIAGDLAVSGNLTYSATSFGDIIPSGTNFSLGNTSLRWGLFANAGNFSGNVTFNSLTTFASSNTTSPSFRIGIGVAPSSPTQGDLWANSTGIFFVSNTSIGGRQLAFTSSNISGSSNTANAWSTARIIALGGDLSGNTIIDGSQNVTLSATLASSLTGKTFTGSISVQGDASSYTKTVSNGSLSISRTVGLGGNSTIDISSGGPTDARRWLLTSANVGTLHLHATNDANSSFINVFSVTRSGVLSFAVTPTVGSQTIWHAGNDGVGSALDAGLFEGQPASFYTNATNLSTGVVPSARLSGTYGIGISGTANNANNLNGQAASFYTNIPARLGYTPINRAGDSVSGNLTFTVGLSNVGIMASYADGNDTGWIASPAANTFSLFDVNSGNFAIRYNRSTNIIELANTIGTFNMVRENRNVLTISNGAISANIANSNFFEITLSNNITSVSYNNMPASGVVQMWVMKVNVGGNFSITWPSAVKWAANATPTLPTGSGNSATIVQYTTDGGTKIHSFYSGPTN